MTRLRRVRRFSQALALIAIASAVSACTPYASELSQEDRQISLKQRSLNTLDQASQLGSKAE